MTREKITKHGRDHRPGGSDPIPNTAGASLCPGDFTSIGAFAVGDGTGHTLAMTVTRGVGCDAVIGIVTATHSPGLSGSILLSITDSRGRTITSPGVGGAIFQTDLSNSLEMTLGLYPVAAGGYAAGDTITCHYDTSPPVSENSAMAFAITGSPSSAFEQANNGNTFGDTFTAGDLLWNDSFGLPTSAFTLANSGAVLTGAAGYLYSGWTPAQGQFLAEHSGGSLYIAASMIPLLDNGVTFEPGGTLSTGTSDLGVASYVFIDLF